jgi:hypothetical protein
MRALRFLRNNPVVILCVAFLAFSTWIGIDLMCKLSKPDLAATAIPNDAQYPLIGPPQAAALHSEAQVSTAPRNGLLSARALPKLKLGMPRVEVEDLVGLPIASRVHPVTLDEGQVTYRTMYEMDDLDLPQTIRPRSRPLRLPKPTREPNALIALVYDASRPGHPLLDVLYPDPLF